MRLYEAQKTITDVFENPFDKTKFSYFIRNLLKNMHPAVFLRTGYNSPKAFKDFIASYERIGKYEDEEGNLIDVLIAKLKRDHSMDYARSTQRNFIRRYLNDKGNRRSNLLYILDSTKSRQTETFIAKASKLKTNHWMHLITKIVLTWQLKSATS